MSQGGGSATVIYWVKARAAAQPPTIPRSAPHKRESSSPKCHSAKVENPWTRCRRAHCSSWFWEPGLSSLTGGCYRISDHLSQPGFSVTIPSSEKSQIQALVLNVIFYDLIQCRKYLFLKVWSANVRCQSSCL